METRLVWVCYAVLFPEPSSRIGGWVLREPADHKKEESSRVWTGFVDSEWLVGAFVLGGMKMKRPR